ncbi:formate dehydrogenase subunit gamma [Paraferrimonas sedimenticola]
MVCAVLFGSGLAMVHIAQADEAQTSIQQAVASQQTGIADMWRAAKSGQAGYTTSNSPFHGALINQYPAERLTYRSDYLAPAIMLSVFGVILIFAAFVAVNGPSRLEKGFSGVEIKRWSKFDVWLHWIGAIPCLLLILTGLTLLGGRYFIQPWVGEAGWAAIVNFSKQTHDVMAIPFIVGWFLMTILWMKNQFLASYDFKWFLVVGGYLNFGPFKGKHPDAGFANAGEKLWFWTFAFAGGAIVVSGIIMLFPNWVEPSRSLSMLAIIIHGASSVLIAAFTVVHIFMATVMSEGGMECMVSGYCDENWAKQHHNVWYDDLKRDNKLEYRA